MILYYALGGGLGHLTRGRRVLEALGLTSDAAIVTASPYASDARVTGGIPVINVPAELEHNVDEHRAWMRGLDAERLLVDTFPGGMHGELCGLDMPMDLVARSLRWAEYRRAMPGELPSFDAAWLLEELEPEHDAFVRDNCRRSVPLDLSHPDTGTTEAAAPYWLIVHSGPEEEVRELIAYTSELRANAASPAERTLVATRCDVPLPEGFEKVDAYPAAALFARAERIVSAAGFNVMLETERWRDKHDVVPFARRFDDQYRRASRRRSG